MPKPETAAPAKDPLRSIAAQLSSPHVDMGLMAALRRFDPRTHARHCLFETLHVMAGAGLDLDATDPLQPRWAMVVHCLALVRGAHDPSRPTGATLFNVHYSEPRLRQLIEADSELMFDLMPLLARRLAAARVATDWWPLADMLLGVGIEDNRADRARKQVVQSYLRAASAKAAA